jgi:hypothetical protein
MLRRVAIVRTDDCEESIASIIMFSRIGELGTVSFHSVLQMLVTNNVSSALLLFTLMMEVISSFETSVLTIITRRNILKGCILNGHRRENLKYYITLTRLAL